MRIVFFEVSSSQRNSCQLADAYIKIAASLRGGYFCGLHDYCFAARFRSFASRYRLRSRNDFGVTSKSSSSSIKSIHCSKLNCVNGVNCTVPSDDLERMLVKCLALQTLISMSSWRL